MKNNTSDLYFLRKLYRGLRFKAVEGSCTRTTKRRKTKLERTLKPEHGHLLWNFAAVSSHLQENSWKLRKGPPSQNFRLLKETRNFRLVRNLLGSISNSQNSTPPRPKTVGLQSKRQQEGSHHIWVCTCSKETVIFKKDASLRRTSSHLLHLF
jgi:hypothetical protein